MNILFDELDVLPQPVKADEEFISIEIISPVKIPFTDARLHRRREQVRLIELFGQQFQIDFVVLAVEREESAQDFRLFDHFSEWLEWRLFGRCGCGLSGLSGLLERWNRSLSCITQRQLQQDYYGDDAAKRVRAFQMTEHKCLLQSWFNSNRKILLILSVSECSTRQAVRG